MAFQVSFFLLIAIQNMLIGTLSPLLIPLLVIKVGLREEHRKGTLLPGVEGVFHPGAYNLQTIDLLT